MKRFVILSHDTHTHTHTNTLSTSHIAIHHTPNFICERFVPLSPTPIKPSLEQREFNHTYIYTNYEYTENTILLDSVLCFFVIFFEDHQNGSTNVSPLAFSLTFGSQPVMVNCVLFRLIGFSVLGLLHIYLCLDFVFCFFVD